MIEVESMRRAVSPDYFGALGIRVRAGRPLLPSDIMSSPVAIVVNRSFVKKYLDDVPVEQAIGVSLGTQLLRYDERNREALIVGVTDDVSQEGINGAGQPELFVSTAQLVGMNLSTQYFILLRTEDDPFGYVDLLRTAVREEDASIALDAIMTMDERVGQSLATPRTHAILMVGFAAFALLIAAAGLFGVLSHSVGQRSREIAVRIALGATRRDVIATAVLQFALAIATGVVAGLAATAALAEQLSPFVYGISTLDWISFGVAPLILVSVAFVACVVPAMRAATIDPLQVLRES